MNDYWPDVIGDGNPDPTAVIDNKPSRIDDFGRMSFRTIESVVVTDRALKKGLLCIVDIYDRGELSVRWVKLIRNRRTGEVYYNMRRIDMDRGLLYPLECVKIVAVAM